jgi:hypothetical protein
MPYYMATIDVLVEVDGYGEACDALAEGMRPLLKEYAETPEFTNFIDWRYNAETPVPVPHDGSGFEYARPVSPMVCDDAGEFREGWTVDYRGPITPLRGKRGKVKWQSDGWVTVDFGPGKEETKCAPVNLSRVFAHLPERCPSNHWNDGTDVCADCGTFLG